MTVHVHIERLVLDGFALSRREAAQVRHAVESELGRLFGDPRPAVVNGQSALGRRIALSLFRQIRTTPQER